MVKYLILVNELNQENTNKNFFIKKFNFNYLLKKYITKLLKIILQEIHIYFLKNKKNENNNYLLYSIIS